MGISCQFEAMPCSGAKHVPGSKFKASARSVPVPPSPPYYPTAPPLPPLLPNGTPPPPLLPNGTLLPLTPET